MFSTDVQKGLTATPKYLLSKYFYDATGSQLFQQIMTLPEYYLTGTEYALIEQSKNQLLSDFQVNERPFRLVELGAGDGTKTKIILRYFGTENALFDYVPIDISKSVLEGLCAGLATELPDLKVHPLCLSYEEALKTVAQLPDSDKFRHILMFMGSNIGNFSMVESVDFLQLIHRAMRPGDLLLLGVDLKKDARQILAAYDDAQSITAQFNLNLLARINRELGGDFDLHQFRFFPTYNPENGEVRSYLQSTCTQTVNIAKLGIRIDFEAWETIFTEVSKKYSLAELAEMAAAAGFYIRHNYLNPNLAFVVSLWSK